jgi:putative Holliday junction resolvase
MIEFQIPEEHPLNLKTILAMDYGEKFIGLATFCVNRDPFPTPFGRIANNSQDAVIHELKKIIGDELIDVIVIGLPFLTDGKKTSTTTKVQEFINFMREQFTLQIYEQDETLSTFEAESRMKNSPRYNFKIDLKQIDAVAASVILEDFIRRTIEIHRL